MDATIVIPVKNGGSLLDKVLAKVFAQKTLFCYEVICVDSGSTDGSQDIVRRYPAKLYEIEPSEFGHGKTRNYGASKGTGEYIIFITQDALPASDDWLDNFIKAMKADPKIVGGFGRHLPYEDCNLIDKRDINGHFDGFGTENRVFQLASHADVIRYNTEEAYRHYLAFFSDNNSCLRRDIWEMYPYDDVDFAEDQIWARKMIEKGYKKLYCSDAAVYHSHNYPIDTYFQRYYDEYKGLYRLHKYMMVRRRADIEPAINMLNERDIAYIDSLENVDKAYWKDYATRRNRARVEAAYYAGWYHRYPQSAQDYLDRKYSQQYRQIAVRKKQHIDKNFIKFMLFDPEIIWGAEDTLIYERSEDIIELEERLIQEENDKNKVQPFGFVLKDDSNNQPNSQEFRQLLSKTSLSVNWILPEMDAGSGGHTTILRFVGLLQKMGFSNRIYFSTSDKFGSDDATKEFLINHFAMSEAFEEGAEVHVGLDDIKPAHATIATFWITAYLLQSINNTISKFYFIQDFEPWFYPMGSEYVIAENSYRLGFRGITAGDWLKNKIHDEYDMPTECFRFSYDKSVYKPVAKRDDIKRVFFYARPATPRREFEVGLLAIHLLKKRMPEVEIVFAGGDTSSYAIDYDHKSLGVVTVSTLAELYSQADLCLVLSPTNLSLLPLEIMGCKGVAVVNRGPFNEWLVGDNNCILVDNDPTDIADKLEYYLNHEDERLAIRDAGYNYALGCATWADEAVKVADAIRRGVEEDM